MRRHWLPVVLMAVLTVFAVAADEKPRTFTFSKDDLGKLPKGWKAAQTGKGEGSVWKVVADDTAPSKKGYVLAQTAESPNAFFNLCVAEDTKYQDVDITVAFKAVKGKLDQGGGVVWRYQDGDNYYIARMNPLEDNFRVYKVVAGKRIQLQTKEDLTVKAGEWHTIQVKMAGDHIECSLDGKKYLDVKDDTFKEAGKVGLWSKADAQSHFDGFTVAGK
jgi:Domain of Unknown Function (DUF1080)